MSGGKFRVVVTRNIPEVALKVKTCTRKPSANSPGTEIFPLSNSYTKLSHPTSQAPAFPPILSVGIPTAHRHSQSSLPLPCFVSLSFPHSSAAST